MLHIATHHPSILLRSLTPGDPSDRGYFGLLSLDSGL